jgi:hypothetical protein
VEAVSDILMTGWRGTEYAKMAAHTLPVMDAYAQRHGLECYCVNLASTQAPPSWMKVPNIGAALADHDRVLWLDADVVIVDPSENIFDWVEADAWQAVVEHETECGLVPNCGVWLVTKAMLPWIEFAWHKMLPAFADHPWWEQGAVMTMMGYRITVTEGWPHATLAAPTELHDRTQFLPPRWNDHPSDRHRPGKPSFVHVTQYADRLGEIRRLCAATT